MGEQLSIFELPLQQPEVPSHKNNILYFPGCTPVPTPAPPKRNNSRKGGEQTVYALKKKEDISRMAQWLQENTEKKYVLAFILGINLGLRANELLTLKFTDIFQPNGEFRYGEDVTDNSDRITVYQSKTSKKRNLYLNDACLAALTWCFPERDERIYRDAYIFSSPYGDHLEVDTLRKKLKKAAKACNINVNIGTHTLRKTFGFWHYQENHDIIFLQKMFGHSSSSITLRYIGISDEDEKRAYRTVSIDPLGLLR